MDLKITQRVSSCLRTLVIAVKLAVAVVLRGGSHRGAPLEIVPGKRSLATNTVSRTFGNF